MKNQQSVLYLIPKASYYNSKKEIIQESNNLHDNLLEKDRILYTYLLFFKNSTYYSKSLIIQRLLQNSLHKEENNHYLQNDDKLLEIEDSLIHYALFNENITHALKLLLGLKDKRVNNSRTTRTILRFLFQRGNLDYISVKYKQKIKDLLIHALGLGVMNSIVRREPKGMKKYNKFIRDFNNPYSLEVIDFVFNKDREYSNKFFIEYSNVREQFKSDTVEFKEPTKLPIEVLEGFNNFYKRGYNIPSLLKNAVVSDKQKIQLQNTVKRQSKNEVEIEIDLNKYSMLEILKHVYNTDDVTNEEIKEAMNIFKSKAVEVRNSLDDDFIVDLSNTAVVLDCSDSHSGSKEARLQPFYKSMILSQVFQDEEGSNLILVGGKEENGLITPNGHTNLGEGLLRAAEKGYKDVIVLSDGFENVGNFDKVYKQLNKIGYNLNVVHFNPVFSPKNFSFKEISDEILAMPFTGEKDIENLFLFYLLNTDEEKFKEVMRDKIENEVLS